MCVKRYDRWSVVFVKGGCARGCDARVSVLCADGGSPVPAQVPAPAPRGGSERGRNRGHEPARARADLHLHRDAVHRRHRVPEHGRKSTRIHVFFVF